MFMLCITLKQKNVLATSTIVKAMVLVEVLKAPNHIFRFILNGLMGQNKLSMVVVFQFYKSLMECIVHHLLIYSAVVMSVILRLNLLCF